MGELRGGTSSGEAPGGYTNKGSEIFEEWEGGPNWVLVTDASHAVEEA